MSTGNCDICNKWDSGLIDGVCLECTNKYAYNVDAARETFEQAFKDPDTKLIKLKKVAELARVSMACELHE